MKDVTGYHPSVYCWHDMSKTKYMHVLIAFFVVEGKKKVLLFLFGLFFFFFILNFLVGSGFRPRH